MGRECLGRELSIGFGKGWYSNYCRLLTWWLIFESNEQGEGEEEEVNYQYDYDYCSNLASKIVILNNKKVYIYIHIVWLNISLIEFDNNIILI